MVLILAFHVPSEPLNTVGDLVKTLTLDEVVHPSYQHDPHGVLLPVIVKSPGIHQVVDFCPRDGQPINMGSIWGTHYTWITRVVELVEHAVANTDVEPIGHPGEVPDLTCGAEILAIVLRELHTLQHPDLSCRSVAMVDSNRVLRAGLVEGAD